MTPADWKIRFADDLVERAAIMHSEGVPDADFKARVDTEAVRRREEQRQGEMWSG